MKATLLIACVGPMQSWGTRSRFEIRDTEKEPTKSGIVGMLAAAQGRDRVASITDLADLCMGVRVDREGILQCDFQTAQNVAVANGGSPKNQISSRYYLADAAFLVALEGPLGLLESLHAGLRNPRWPIFLGRKSYVPTLPPYLADGLRVGSGLRQALDTYPPLVGGDRMKREDRAPPALHVRLVLESRGVTHETRNDQPVNFSIGRRAYRTRYVITENISILPARVHRGAP